MYVSLSLPRSFSITMINFCKKSVHSLFNITSTDPQEEDSSISADHHRNTPPYTGVGLSFLTNSGDIPKPNNVIESSSLIKRRDRIEIGLRVLQGGGDVDGLSSCTESLGFESCTERSLSNEFDKYEIDNLKKTSRVKKKSKNIVDKRNNKMMMKKLFPPPLKSLNDNGKPMFYLKPVRKDGRLELTEVKIHRQESLRACREDGRLRLQLVVSAYRNEDDIVIMEDTIKEKKKVVEEEWKKFPGGGGEDCRWLHEMVVSHHNMHGWGQQCVTIR